MAQDQRPEGHAEIDDLAAVDVMDAGAGAAGHEAGSAADAFERPHW
jgi:hypothetical protein